MIDQPERLFQALLSEYGPQGWWPAETPFEVMVGAILTQNTAWSNVERAIDRLRRELGLDPYRIVAVAPDTLAAAIRPSGYFNLKAKRLQAYCQWYLDEGELSGLDAYGTQQLRQALLSVYGVGPETADDILLYAFDRDIFVVDAYTRRLFARLGLVGVEEDYEAVRDYVQRQVSGGAPVFNDFHALIVRHAKEVCGKKPKCEVCFLSDRCRRRGI